MTAPWSSPLRSAKSNKGWLKVTWLLRGCSGISKQGNPKLRNLLFMCRFNACKSNKACRELYERIVAKGKSKKLALIAVANKLMKQAFAIAKSVLIYDPEFRSIKPKLN